MSDHIPQLPDVQAVRTRARIEWEKSARKRIGIQERIGQSVPWWLMAIATVFYLLSAPHTAATFNLLTPGWGFAAPIGVEFGTVYVAFIRYQLRSEGKHIPIASAALGYLMVLIAFVVNGAGAFNAVIGAVGLDKLPFADIVARFGSLPASSEVALLLVPLAAIVIPLGALVAGEGVAALILERRTNGDLIEMEWRRVRFEVEFTYLRDAAVQAGVQPAKAAQWASSLIREVSISSGVQLSEADKIIGQSQNKPKEIADGPAQTKHGHGTGYKRMERAQDKVLSYLSTHPSALSMSVRSLALTVGVGKSTAADALAEYKKSIEITHDSEV